jgi:hypothetical protein
MATTLGELGAAYEAAYTATLPADAGPPAITKQPTSVPLFSGAHLEWVGGSTYASTPDVRVERLVGGQWTEYANTEGDIELTVKMPTPEQLVDWRSGSFAWKWTAAFEAFGSDIALPDASGDTRRKTPFGTYRFVVDGQWRPATGTTAPYELVGQPFEVVPWDGIAVSDLRAETRGVSFLVGPGPSAQAYPGDEDAHIGQIDVPDSYTSPFRYIDNRRVQKVGNQFYCSFCHFRPWADTSDIERATVLVQRPRGKSGRSTTLTLSATFRDGRWFVEGTKAGDRVSVAKGAVVDTFGNVNGDGIGPILITGGPGAPRLRPGRLLNDH